MLTANGGRGSLRAAISAANAGAPVVSRIEIPTGTYELSACGADNSNAASDLDLRVNQPIALVATGPDVVVRQTCAGERVLDRMEAAPQAAR